MNGIPDTRNRILCLHGGGVTGAIFKAQARSIIKALPEFRFIFADGPYFCDPHAAIIPVYQDWGPFRRWLRWLPEHPATDAESAVEEIKYALETCANSDEGTGPIVGLMGFSQGAKLAASLLYEQEAQMKATGSASTQYQFAVLLAGRCPLVSMSSLTESPGLVSAGDVSEGFDTSKNDRSHILSLPSVHVHGLNDVGLHLHRKLLHEYCDPASTRLVEWDGEHRVPIKQKDVQKIVDAVRDVVETQTTITAQ
ncbi:hypothetical protein EV356DRAFT_503297 [Viridothelium virens]|uniref:Serine hydrolase domain-containing protein n=1 Tax=Viridothelium virens TaxID=1048519 RepID=A0A6A6H6P5_VIRVR|nr:hypothetical protein EV356DRAFT_503297 [Viridothelium virens]